MRNPSTTHSPELSLVIPLLNEGELLRDTVLSLTSILKEASLRYQLVLVDNGSTDNSRELLLELARDDASLELVLLPSNLGYGGGILEGLKVATAPVVGWLWGDGQVGHYAVLEVYQKLVQENLDLCKATRKVRLDGIHRRAVTMAYHTFFPLFFPRPSSDIHGCPKLFKASALSSLHLTSKDWFLDAEALIKAEKANLKRGELEVVCYAREGGQSKVRLQTLLQFTLNLSHFRLTGRTRYE